MGCLVKCLVLLLFPLMGKASESYACDSSIYCKGDLLDAIQIYNVFRDSKTFVDMPLKFEADTVLENFENLRNRSQLTKEKLEQFLKDNFEEAGQELELWTPSDWVESPKLLQRIKNQDYKDFAKGLNDLWKLLGRKIKGDVAENPDRYSLLNVPHPFMVPGDRFREFYYWDTYWVIKGLLLCEMHTTAKNIILNFLNMVERFGHVPNGGRIYYTRRSQPPLLIPMADVYLRLTNDTQFIRENLHLFEREYNFWGTNRTRAVTYEGRRYNLSQYNVDNGHPRPEGYREDQHVAQQFLPDQRAQVYKDLASAAESGWDFSTRWFDHKGSRRYNLSSIKTTNIIPVDLNTFLCVNEALLAKFADLLGNTTMGQMYRALAEKRWEAINEVFWNEEDGVWYDLDLSESEPKHSRAFFASNVYPLMIHSKDAHAGHLTLDSRRTEKVLQYLTFEGALTFPGGVPTSKINSGQQWDFPNAWPPIVSLVVESLRSSDSSEAKTMAAKLASDWVVNNYITWREYQDMYEKYNVLRKGRAGGGGEYGVQVGFGWTNGVILEFLDLYGSEISLDPEYSKDKAEAPASSETQCNSGSRIAISSSMISSISVFTLVVATYDISV